MSRFKTLLLITLLTAPLGQAATVVTTLDRTIDYTYGTLVIGADGLGFVAYPDEHLVTTTAHCSNALCTSATVSAYHSAQGGNTVVAIGGDGLPLVIHDDGAVGLNSMHCANVACTAITAGGPVALSSLGYSLWPSLEIGADGRGLLAYTEVSGGLAEIMAVAHCADAACTSATATTIQAHHAQGASLGIVASGFGFQVRRGLIAYRDVQLDRLKVAECADVACSSVQVTTLGTITGDPSLHAADSSSASTYVAYEDQGELEVQRCPTTGCAGRGNPPRTVATPGATVRPAVVIGSDGLPIVVYSTGSLVKTTHCSDATCDTYTRHVIEDLGNNYHASFVSAAIGADGLPLIAYGKSNGTASYLKVAHCSDAVCTP